MVEHLMQYITMTKGCDAQKGMLPWGDARHTLTQVTSICNRPSMLYL